MRFNRFKKIKTDGDVVRLARQMDTHIFALQELFYALRESDHPNAATLTERIEDNMLPPLALATHIIDGNLEHSERWESGVWGIRRKKK